MIVQTKTIAKGWDIALPAADEAARLRELESYHVLDTVASTGFDRITNLLSRQLNVPIALVSLVDFQRQWFKSCHGIDARETPRDMAFCSHAIHLDAPLIVPDATKDDRFCGNPLVTGAPFVRFYAGTPLIAPSRHRLGTLCAIDTVSRDGLSEEEVFLLRALADMVVDELLLHRANTQLEEQLQARSNFVAVLGHEVRTPMNGIIGMASLLAEVGLPEKEHRYVDLIQKSADSMMELLNDLLDLSKLEAGKMHFESERLDIVQLIKDVMSLVSQAAQNKNIKLTFDYPETLSAFALGDEMRIRQVVLNLLSNAIKFTNEGSVAVRLSGEMLENEMHYRIEVQDSGIGISTEDQQRIFRSFEQSNMSATRQHEGTGLGLAICRQLCELMGGEITLQSELGQGSRFNVLLPLKKDPARDSLPHAPEPDLGALNYHV